MGVLKHPEYPFAYAPDTFVRGLHYLWTGEGRCGKAEQFGSCGNSDHLGFCPLVTNMTEFQTNLSIAACTIINRRTLKEKKLNILIKHYTVFLL